MGSPAQYCARRHEPGNQRANPTQTRYYLNRLTVPPTDFNRYIRPHWQIENRLHWKPDVVFREDRQHTRPDNGPLNLATARKLAL